MTTYNLAAQIEVGHHRTAELFRMTINVDTVVATAIAAVIVLALAFFIRSRVTSTGSSRSARPVRPTRRASTRCWNCCTWAAAPCRTRC